MHHAKRLTSTALTLLLGATLVHALVRLPAAHPTCRTSHRYACDTGPPHCRAGPQPKCRTPPACETPHPSCPRRPPTAHVVRIVDGDTLLLAADHRPARRVAAERVRLIGVDAPETWARHDCFGEEATLILRRLLPPGTVVRLAGDQETRDRYGRLLRYLWKTDGLFINAELIRQGAARTMAIEPNTHHLPSLHDAEAQARHDHRGIWTACPPPTARSP